LQKIIFVNATSLNAGGALAILNKYIEDIIIQRGELIYRYYIFVPDNCELLINDENIVIIKNKDNSFYVNRNFWNLIGMKLWSFKNSISPNELYSLQNYYPLGFNSSNIFKRLYLHTVIPFSDVKWNIFKKEERILWLYKNIYSHLIERSIRKSDNVIIQTHWFKEKLIEQLKINKEVFSIERPEIESIELESTFNRRNKNQSFKIFYPASEMIYKNHEILYKMMNILVNEKKMKDIVLYLTIASNNVTANFYIEKFKLRNNIILIGNINFKSVLKYYNTVNVLVFPSKLESFGLPLIEAQQFNLPIIANDMALYKEVIGNYKEKVLFCNSEDAYQWVQAVCQIKVLTEPANLNNS